MQNRPLAAAAFILAGTGTIGFIDQFIRVIASESSLWTFHVVRSAMIWGIALAWIGVTGRSLRVTNWRGVIARSAIMATALIVYFGALGFMPVAQAAAGLFTSPIWMLVFSVTLFGLSVGPVRICAVLLGFLGVILVLSPDPSNLDPLVFLPVLGGAFYAVAAIATREWCAGEAALTLALGSFTGQALWGIGGVIVFGAWGDDTGFLTQGWVTPSAEVLGWCLLQAVGSLLAVVFLTRGYQLAEASLVSVFEYSVLGFGALFGLLVWGERLSPVTLAGLVLIAGAGSLIALRGRRDAVP
ncbi:DMT family transporter [Jannaschia sp. S6380]|uniref:DMT family transporter n=1 Tax=Jannaschia sp. S6380 TaxID=2926408 RepID=UPI001FF2A9AB|nr:DMT family transporter [Jannaschia sp. S6380]MCK0166330.1 DMT family transporter [Jannaschia sp. S6380]